MPRTAGPVVNPYHDLDGGQAALRPRALILLTSAERPVFVRDLRGL